MESFLDFLKDFIDFLEDFTDFPKDVIFIGGGSALRQSMITWKIFDFLKETYEILKELCGIIKEVW